MYLWKRRKAKWIIAMVCHWSRAAKDSSAPPEKKCTSFGSCRPSRLCATWAPSPWAQVLTLSVTGRGSFPSLKIVFHPMAKRVEEDATLDLNFLVGRTPLVGSRITMPLAVTIRGVLKGTSSCTQGWSVVRCLFRVRVAGGCWPLP